MARELTIQIRLTEQEHATIAAQAAREGLGVSTFLRALALRTALQAAPTPAGRAAAALRRSQERSVARGLTKLKPDEIEAAIRQARAGRRRS